MSDSDGPGRREVAHRLFAAEFEDADLSYSESDEERAPNYVVTPSGARVNRLFAVGVLTEVEQVSEDVLRGRVVDPTGAFVLYAGQYQPDEQAFLDRAEPPMFVAVTGKARTFQPDDADTVYTSVRPEMISEVDADTRDRWTVDAAERTLDRVATFAAAARMDERGDALAAALGEQGVDESLAEGVALALEHYGTTGTYLAALRELALDAARVVAGQREEVEPLTADPGAGDDGALADLAAELEEAGEPAEPAATAEVGTDVEAGTADASAGDAGRDSAETTATTASTAPAGTAESAESTEAATSSGTTGSTTAATTGTTGPDESSEATESAGTAATVEPTAGADATAEDAGAATGTEAVAGAEESDDIGDFEGGGSGSSDEEVVDDLEPEEFELDEGEREAIEEEYGTDFQSGAEVDEPGEAGIEAPAAEPETGEGEGGEPAAGGASEPEPEPEAVSEPDTTSEPGAGADTQTGTDAGAGADDDAGGDGPAAAGALEGEELEDAVVDLMGDLDEGDGVARAELVGAATEQHGADAGAVEDAIQDALMGGRCYEPDDGTLKPI